VAQRKKAKRGTAGAGHALDIEYGAMREEILARIRMRQQVIGATLVLAAALLGVGMASPVVALIYPPLAAFLAVAWAQNDYRIGDLGTYIRETIEPRAPALHWESWVAERRWGQGAGSWRAVVFAHGGLFLFTQAMATLVGFLWLLTPAVPGPASIRLVAWTLFVFDVFAIALAVWVVVKAKRGSASARRAAGARAAAPVAMGAPLAAERQDPRQIGGKRMGVPSLPDAERDWVREEALGLLKGAHDTMARVLLAQFGVLGAALIRGVDAKGFDLAVLAVCGLSLLGSFYSFEQLRHARFLHLYLAEVGAGSRFVHDMLRLRELARQDGRPVKRRGWEERICVAGYVAAPAILLAFLVLAPSAAADRYVLPVLVVASTAIVLLAWRCARLFRLDQAIWQWYFSRSDTSGA
jgi:hypothetical protein